MRKGTSTSTPGSPTTSGQAATTSTATGCNRLARRPPSAFETEKVSTTDGPFAETKEQLGGYYMIDARDLNEAIQVAARIPGARDRLLSNCGPSQTMNETLRALGFAAQAAH